MTFQEWCRGAGVMGTHPTTERGAVSVICTESRVGTQWYHALFRLSDYKVSSVCGVVIWLVPVQFPILKEQPTAAAGGSNERDEKRPDEFHEWQDTGGEA